MASQYLYTICIEQTYVANYLHGYIIFKNFANVHRALNMLVFKIVYNQLVWLLPFAHPQKIIRKIILNFWQFILKISYIPYVRSHVLLILQQFRGELQSIMASWLIILLVYSYNNKYLEILDPSEWEYEYGNIYSGTCVYCGHVGTNQMFPDYQGVLIFQVSLCDKAPFGTINKCVVSLRIFRYVSWLTGFTV